MNFGAADETCHALGWRVLWCYRQGGPDVLDISPGRAKPLISAVASESSLRHQKVETPGHVFLDEICMYAAGYLFRAQCSYVHQFPAAKPCFHFCCPMLPFNHSIFGWSFEAFACVPSWEFLDLFNLFIFRVSSIGGIYSKTWVGVFCCFNRHWFLHAFFGKRLTWLFPSSGAWRRRRSKNFPRSLPMPRYLAATAAKVKIRWKTEKQSIWYNVVPQFVS